MKKNILLLTTMMLGALVWTGCQKDPLEVNLVDPGAVPEDSVWTISVKAVKAGNDATTKGLDIGGGEEGTTTVLNSIWKYDDVVKVFQGTDCIGTLSATPDNLDPHSAVLSGTVTISSITPSTTRLTFLTPREDIDYTGQAGNLLPGYGISDPIETLFHYTIAADILVTECFASNITTEMATFVPMQSIYRMNFRFQDGGQGDKTNITAKSVTVSAANGHLVQTQSIDGATVAEGAIAVSLQHATADPFFVALRNRDESNEEVLTFTIVDEDGATYKGTKTIPSDAKPNGSFVSIKNTTVTSRMDIPLLSSSTATVL